MFPEVAFSSNNNRSNQTVKNVLEDNWFPKIGEIGFVSTHTSFSTTHPPTLLSIMLTKHHRRCILYRRRQILTWSNRTGAWPTLNDVRCGEYRECGVGERERGQTASAANKSPSPAWSQIAVSCSRCYLPTWARGSGCFFVHLWRNSRRTTLVRRRVTEFVTTTSSLVLKSLLRRDLSEGRAHNTDSI